MQTLHRVLVSIPIYKHAPHRVVEIVAWTQAES